MPNGLEKANKRENRDLAVDTGITGEFAKCELIDCNTRADFLCVMHLAIPCIKSPYGCLRIQLIHYYYRHVHGITYVRDAVCDSL